VPFKKWFQELDPAYEMYDRVGYLVFTTSVGCPYKCSYCISPKLWTYERREPVRVVDTIEKYVNIFPVKDIVFFDDAILVETFQTLTQRINRSADLCEISLAKWGTRKIDR